MFLVGLMQISDTAPGPGTGTSTSPGPGETPVPWFMTTADVHLCSVRAPHKPPTPPLLSLESSSGSCLGCDSLRLC